MREAADFVNAERPNDSTVLRMCVPIGQRLLHLTLQKDLEVSSLMKVLKKILKITGQLLMKASVTVLAEREYPGHEVLGS